MELLVALLVAGGAWLALQLHVLPKLGFDT